MIGAGDGSRKGVFAASLAIHVMLLGVFPLLISRFGGDDEPEPIDVVFYRQAEERPALVAPERPEPPEPPVEPEPVIEVARVEPPKPERRPEPRPTPRPEPRPLVRQAQQQSPPAPLPEKPRREVRTDLFAQAQQEPSPAPARRLPKETRSAGFAAVEVEPAPQRERKNRAAARSGVFEVEPSPAENAPTVAKRQRAVNRGGFGDEAPAATPAGNTSRERGAVKTGGFGDAEAVAPAARRRDKPEESPDTPVEILSKPKPAYTAEARELKVEGEVVLKVVFDAAGKMRVLNIVEGLGHGLDEAAVEAAKEIEFKPAKRNGKPVDHTAVLRIVFQLA